MMSICGFGKCMRVDSCSTSPRLTSLPATQKGATQPMFNRNADSITRMPCLQYATGPDPAGVLNRVAWMQKNWPIQQSDCVAFSSAPCFVDSTWQMFAPLLLGELLYTCSGCSAPCKNIAALP